jgi:hypothetical protein
MLPCTVRLRDQSSKRSHVDDQRIGIKCEALKRALSGDYPSHMHRK